jgi:hypothetical protein
MTKRVRWTATYETVLLLPDNATDQDVQDAVADIPVDVDGSEYVDNSWDVKSIRDV